MEILNAGQYTGDIIQKMKFDDVVITNTLYSAKKNNPEWHYHENMHICFVFQGGRGKADTRHQSRYTAPNGSLFSYHAEEMHRWISPDPICKSANVEIGQAFLKNNGFSEAKIIETIQKSVEAKTLFIKMQREMLTNDLNSSLSIQSLLLELLSKPEKSSLKAPPTWVLTLSELLNDNWNTDMNLTDMANLLRVHPVTISKHFRKYFSCTLGEYRRKLKIEKSIDLIKNTNKSLTEIAFLCNFSDQSHFTRNFKHRTGFLPKDFRSF